MSKPIKCDSHEAYDAIVRSLDEDVKVIHEFAIRNEIAISNGDSRIAILEARQETIQKNLELILANQQEIQKKAEWDAGCIFCSSTFHLSINCKKYTTAMDRKLVLVHKGLCINCFRDFRHDVCPEFEKKPCTFCTASGRVDAGSHSSRFCPLKFPGEQTVRYRKRSGSPLHEFVECRNS